MPRKTGVNCGVRVLVRMFGELHRRDVEVFREFAEVRHLA